MKLAHLSSGDLPGLVAWARRLVDDLNRFNPSIEALPTFADDAAASEGRVKVGQAYVTPDGLVRRRVA